MKLFYRLSARFISNSIVDAEVCSISFYNGDKSYTCPWSKITQSEYDSIANQFGYALISRMKANYDKLIVNGQKTARVKPKLQRKILKEEIEKRKINTAKSMV